MYDLIGKEFGTAIDDVFKRMEIAEQEIAAGMVLHQDHAALINDAFMLAGPSPYMTMNLSTVLYAKHVDELINRIVADEKIMSWPTRAEMCVQLCQESLVRPLDQDETCAYVRCMLSVFGPDAAPEAVLALGQHESYEGAADEVLGGLSGRMRKRLLYRDEEWQRVLTKHAQEE